MKRERSSWKKCKERAHLGSKNRLGDSLLPKRLRLHFYIRSRLHHSLGPTNNLATLSHSDSHLRIPTRTFTGHQTCHTANTIRTHCVSKNHRSRPILSHGHLNLRLRLSARSSTCKAPNMADGQTSINIPQIIAVALVGFFAIRWFLQKPSGPAQEPRPRRPNQIDLVKVEQVAAMFPQLDRRTIAWDLQRNGWNVQATTERVLAGRQLDNPPVSFQPNLPSPTQQAPAAGAKSSGAGRQQDLITRYGLQAKVGGKGKEPVPSEEQKRNAWSSDKAARAEGLKKRREAMILEARRKMQERDGSA
jgi:coupling of ubiquitin conjugation to ER degradation protein 1